MNSLVESCEGKVENSISVSPTLQCPQSLEIFANAAKNKTKKASVLGESSATDSVNLQTLEIKEKNYTMCQTPHKDQNVVAENTVSEKESIKDNKQHSKGSLRRDLSIGSFRKMFRKHSRSFSESPMNGRRLELSDEDNSGRMIKSEIGYDNVGTAASLEHDEVFGKNGAPISQKMSTISMLPPRSRLRHTSTLSRIHSPSRNDSQESSDALKDEKLKALQLWQKACGA